MIQKFLCPKCGNVSEVPVEGFEVGATEVDCLCGASMIPSGGLEPETEVPPGRDRLLQKKRRVEGLWRWIALLLLFASVIYLLY